MRYGMSCMAIITCKIVAGDVPTIWDLTARKSPKYINGLAAPLMRPLIPMGTYRETTPLTNCNH